MGISFFVKISKIIRYDNYDFNYFEQINKKQSWLYVSVLSYKNVTWD